MVEQRIPLSLLMLPPQVLGAMWPAEQVMHGLSVCKQVRDALQQNAPNVPVTFRVTTENRLDKDLRKGFRAFLQRMQGKVQLQCGMEYSLKDFADAMRGKVDALHLIPTSCDRNEGIVEILVQCMPGLHTLSMHGPLFVDELVRLLLQRVFTEHPASFPMLQELSFKKMDFKQHEWTHVLKSLRSAAALRKLHLHFCKNEEYRPPADEVGQTVGALSKLESLCVQRWSPRAPGFVSGLRRAGGALSALLELTLDECSFGDDISQLCELLAAAPSLTALSLFRLDRGGGGDARAIGEQLASMTGLTALRMDRCIRDDVEVGQGDMAGWLAECTGLRSLQLANMTLTSAELLALVHNVAPCARLRELHVRNVCLAINAADTIGEGLAQRLAALPALTSLDFSGTPLTDEEAAIVRARLTTRLQRLVL